MWNFLDNETDINLSENSELNPHCLKYVTFIKLNIHEMNLNIMEYKQGDHYFIINFNTIC